MSCPSLTRARWAPLVLLPASLPSGDPFFHRPHLSRREQPWAPPAVSEAPTNALPAIESSGGPPAPINGQAPDEADQVVEALSMLLGVGGDRVLQLLAGKIAEALALNGEGGEGDTVGDPSQDRLEGGVPHTTAPNRDLGLAPAGAIQPEGGRGGAALEAPVRQARSLKRKGAPTSLPSSLIPGQPVVSHPGPSGPAPPKSPRVLPVPGPSGVSPAPPPPNQAGSSQARVNRSQSRKSSQKRVSFVESTEASLAVSPASQSPSTIPGDPPEIGGRMKGKTRALLANARFSPGVSVRASEARDDDDVVEVGHVWEPLPPGGRLPQGAPAGLGAGGGDEVPAPASANPIQAPKTVTIGHAEFLRLTAIAQRHEERKARRRIKKE